MTCERCKSNVSSKYGSGRFCSRACANTRKHSQDTKAKIASTLSKKEYAMHPNARKALFSKEIMKLATANRIKSRDANRKKFEETQPFTKWKRSWQYEYIANRANHICEECSLNLRTADGRGPYEIHHIDGNRQNNDKDNLQYLCLICHWKTDNYRFRGRTHSAESIAKQHNSKRKNGSIA